MIAFFRECLCTCCLGWQEGMRDSWIFPYFFPYAVTVIRTYWYVMQQSGIKLGNNDPKSGILTTYGIIPCNSNPSSSAKKIPDRFAWLGIFHVCGYTSIACAVTKTVFLQIKLDNHFTFPVFWILHELDMIEP